MVMYKSLYESKIGTIILTSDGNYLTNLCFTTSRFINHTKYSADSIKDDLDIFIKTKKWLDRYFNGLNPSTNEIPFKLNGSVFCKKVWNELLNIPYGTIVTYKDIADLLNTKGYQAIGYAVGHNPISIIVPCHRVIGKNNSLTGYGEGIDKKIQLLNLEGVDTTNLH